MKYIHTLSVICCIFISGVLIVSPFGSCAQKDRQISITHSESNQVTGLQISFLTDKKSYLKGDEIHFEVIFFNGGESPFRILIDDTFVGGNIHCTDIQGNKYSYEGGYHSWSPKAGLFTGRTYLLKPREKISIKMDALIFDNYQLIFSSLSDPTVGIDYEKFKKNKNLPSGFPDKYISAGRIFPLLKPNTFRFTYIYETTDADKQWKFLPGKTPQETSLDLLWIGKATSNSIEISIQ